MKLRLPNSYTRILLSIWVVGMVLLIWRSVTLCNGHLVYALDDPYIHLSVAENILYGGYGVNAGEYSAPCSSIIYPFILAGTEWLGLGIFGPLVLNLLAMGASVLLVGKILEAYVFPATIKNNTVNLGWAFPLFLGTLLLGFVMNAWGLVMTGMEHSLHVLACLGVVLCFLRLINDRKASTAFLLISIVFLPLIRFEGFALAILSIIFLFYLGRPRAALGALFAIIMVVACWAYFMRIHQLPFFPSSVSTKSAIISSASDDSFFLLTNFIWNNLLHSFMHSRGQVFWAGMLPLIYLIVKCRPCSKDCRILGLVIFLIGLSHVIFGRFGSFSRYEIYASILIWLGVFIFLKDYFDCVRVRIGLVLVLLVIAKPNSYTLFNTPAASLNIYQQQFQMHRFVVDFWNRPVAVNDLGYVSYRNPMYVLDLWGLGSEEMRVIKKSGELSSPKIEALIEKKKIGMVMIYDSWFKDIVPKKWIKVASLQTSWVTAGGSSVEFYVTSKVELNEVRKLLSEFEMSLPPGAKLKYNKE